MVDCVRTSANFRGKEAVHMDKIGSVISAISMLAVQVGVLVVMVKCCALIAALTVYLKRKDRDEV